MARLSLLLLLALPAAAALLWPAAPAIVGTVASEAGPVCAARVRIKATRHATRTDALGAFSLAPGPRVTASAPGFLIAGAPARQGMRLHLKPLPEEDEPDYAWVDPTPDPADPARCGNCHKQTHREWAAGGHARSATSPTFRRVYGRLLDEHPDGSAVCSSCHAPGLRASDPAITDLRHVRGVSALGTHCDFCHKVAGQGDGTIGLTHGEHLLKLLRPKEGHQLFFGPLDDVDRGEDAYSPFFRDSRYCAACHEGTVFGVPVYTTYSEWLASPAARAGRQCQDCHMRPTGRMTNTAPGRGGVERDPLTLSNHSFWDGSQREMLRRALRVQVRLLGAAAEVRVLADDVGHRIPTGFIERRLEAEAEGLDADGHVLRVHRWVYTRDTGGVPFWKSPNVDDNRLSPGVPDVRRLDFGVGLASVRVRLTHRRHEGGPAIEAWP